MIIWRNPNELMLTDGTNFISDTADAPYATVRKCMQVTSCSIFLIFQMRTQYFFHL